MCTVVQKQTTFVAIQEEESMWMICLERRASRPGGDTQRGSGEQSHIFIWKASAEHPDRECCAKERFDFAPLGVFI